jgi:hypothetical protein
VTAATKPKIGRPRRSTEPAANYTLRLTVSERNLLLARAAAEVPPVPVAVWIRRRLDLDP